MEPISILLSQLRDMAREAISILPQLLISILVIVLTYFAASLVRKLVRRIFKNSRMRPSLANLIVILSSMGIWVIGIMVAAIIAFPNLTPTKMLAGLGIGSVAIGFAFKDVFENFLAGIIILLRREMRINDFIECVGLEGKVENILVRETHVRQSDGQLVIIPNSMLFKNPVIIRTDLDQRRTTIICGVAYSEDVERSRSVITAAVVSCESVISDSRPVQVFAQEFADSSINFEVTWWTGSKPLDVRYSRDEVIQSIKSALDDANIEIPFPYRTLTFNESLKVEKQGSE
ncbi:mechanosensitive ion channel family protein [Leucothrix mucor]|uniref:mechanosensitive ion channel family protein n=1 Tax=Leucothrix mucor TaxID=45248 RepID=UPI0003B5C434|nr:mechanosensitive ion channel [Leucothrix mucor]